MKPLRNIAALIVAAGFAVLLAGCATPAARPPSSFARELSRHPEHGVLLKGVPNHAARSGNTDMAVLADVLSFWKVKITPERLDAAMHPDHGELTWDEAVTAYGARHQLVAFISTSSMDDLKLRLRSGVPAIVRLQDDAREPPRLAVVAGFDDEARLYLCHQGEREPVVQTYDEFSVAWSKARRWMLVLCPPESPSWPLSAGELMTRARFHEQAKELRLATRDYEAVRASNPDDIELCIVLANLYRLDGQLDKAEQLYRHMLSLNDLDGRAANNLAYVLAEKGESLDEALQLARRANTLEPSNAFAMDTLGFVYLARGQYDEAARILERARSRARSLSREQQSEIAMNLVWAHYRGGQHHLARQVLADVRRLTPDFPIPDELRVLLDPAPTR